MKAIGSLFSEVLIAMKPCMRAPRPYFSWLFMSSTLLAFSLHANPPGGSADASDPTRIQIQTVGQGATYQAEVHFATAPQEIAQLEKSITAFEAELNKHPGAVVSLGVQDTDPEGVAADSKAEVSWDPRTWKELNPIKTRSPEKWADIKLRWKNLSLKFASFPLFKLGVVLTDREVEAAREVLGEQGPYERMGFDELRERFRAKESVTHRLLDADIYQDMRGGDRNLYVLDKTGGLIKIQKPGVLASFSFVKLVMGPSTIFFGMLSKGHDPLQILPMTMLSAGWQIFINSEKGRLFQQKLADTGYFSESAKRKLEQLRNQSRPVSEDGGRSWAASTWALLKSIAPMEIRYVLSDAYLFYLKNLAEPGHVDRAIKYMAVNQLYNLVDTGLRYFSTGIPFADGRGVLENFARLGGKIFEQSALDASGSIIWATSFNRIIDEAELELLRAQESGDPERIQAARTNLEAVWTQQRLLRNNLGSVGTYFSAMKRIGIESQGFNIIAMNAVGMAYNHAVSKTLASDTTERFRTFTGYMKTLAPSVQQVKTFFKGVKDLTPLKRKLMCSDLAAPGDDGNE
ncbi:MAG: hypothetical protein K2X47_04450 [Bdellovibrionales bacterium]|nr:hypothetical protein [Bdellovibrionales bacterium]